MKSMTQEEKLEEAKRLYKDANADQRYVLERLFPELAESENERIRKALIDIFSLDNKKNCHDEISNEQILAWLEKQVYIDKEKVLIGARKDVALSIMYFLDRNALDMCLSNMECEDLEDAVVNSNWSKVYDYMKKKLEKQDEQKHVADKGEPKFKVGNLVVNNYGYIWKIKEIVNKSYILEGIDGWKAHPTIEWGNKILRLWDITKDAKDGDVLQLGEVTAIFKEFIGNGNCRCYCSVCDGEFEIPSQDGADNSYGCHNATPATKEQRDTLEKAMADAGYAFDFDKKKLKKVEDEPNKCEGCNNVKGCVACVDGSEWAHIEEHNPAWSEEDERFFKTALWHISFSISNGKSTDIHCDTTEWLKSVKERCTWKPSEEQIEALEHFVRSIGESGYASPYENNTKLLYSLLEQIKKLREE